MEIKYNADIINLQNKNDKLETHLSGLKDDLQEAKELNTSLTFEIQNSTNDRMDDNSLEVSELLIVNKHLKDKNDELIMKLQSFANLGEDLEITDESPCDGSRTDGSLVLPQPQPESLKQECE